MLHRQQPVQQPRVVLSQRSSLSLYQLHRPVQRGRGGTECPFGEWSTLSMLWQNICMRMSAKALLCAGGSVQLIPRTG